MKVKKYLASLLLSDCVESAFVTLKADVIYGNFLKMGVT